VKPPSNATPSKAGDARFVEPLPKTPSLGFKTPLLGAKEPPVKSVATPRGLTSSTLSGGRGRSNDDEVDSHAGGGGGGDSMNTVVNLLKSISEKIEQIPPAASPALSWMSSSRTPSKIRGEGSESVRATPLKKKGIFLFFYPSFSGSSTASSFVLSDDPITRGRDREYGSDADEGSDDSGDCEFEFEGLHQPTSRSRFVTSDLDLRSVSP